MEFIDLLKMMPGQLTIFVMAMEILFFGLCSKIIV